MRRLVGLSGLSIVSLLIAVGEAHIGMGASPQVCSPGVPAHGTVPDPTYTFSYKSWAEPYGTDAAQYHYVFTDTTNHKIPVRWSDAGITQVAALPGQPIESDFTDALPTHLRSSEIDVGPEGAGAHPYMQPNCFSDSADASGILRGRKLVSHFRGIVASPDGTPVKVDVAFASESKPTVGGADVGKYTVSHRVSHGQENAANQVSWTPTKSDAPTTSDFRPLGTGAGVEAWATQKFPTPPSVASREAIVADSQGRVLVKIRVPTWVQHE